MVKKSHNIFDWKMPTARFEALTDAVFAIVITLLVLPLIEFIIDKDFKSNKEFLDFLLDHTSNFFTFFLAFFLLALFWRTSHRHFSMIRYVNEKFFWLNILWLMFIVLIPFSTFIVGNYGSHQFPQIFFHLNIFAIWSLTYLHLDYVSKNAFLLKKGIEMNQITVSKRSALVIVMLSWLGIGLTLLTFIIYFRPSISNIVYIFIPLCLKLVAPNE